MATSKSTKARQRLFLTGEASEDFAHCTNVDCPKRTQCFRGNSPPALLQWYAHFQPNGAGECDYFIDKGGENRHDFN